MLKNIKNIVKSRVLKHSIKRYERDIERLELSVEFYKRKVSSYNQNLELYDKDTDSKKYDAICHVYEKMVDAVSIDTKELVSKKKKLEKLLSL